MAMIAAEMGGRAALRHPGRALAALALTASGCVSLLSGLGFGLSPTESVTAGKGALTEVALINPNVCGGEMTAHVTDDTASWGVKVKLFGLTSPKLLTSKETLTADIGGKICATQSDTVPAKYDLNKKKFVVTLNSATTFSMTVYPQKFSFVKGNDFLTAEVDNLSNLIKVIPGVGATWTDSKANALEEIDFLEAYRVAAKTCGVLALEHLTDPNASKQNKQIGPNTPTTIQEQIINNMVANANSVEQMTHVHFSPDDFEVDITPGALVLPTQYDDQIAEIQAHKPDGLTFPNITKIPACVDQTSSTGVKNP